MRTLKADAAGLFTNSPETWWNNTAGARHGVCFLFLFDTVVISLPRFVTEKYNLILHPFSRIKLHFKDSKGVLIKTVEANEGDDILSIAHEHDIDLEGTSLPVAHVLTAFHFQCGQLYRRMRRLRRLFNMPRNSLPRALWPHPRTWRRRKWHARHGFCANRYQPSWLPGEAYQRIGRHDCNTA